MKMNRVGKLTLFSVLVLWIMVLAGCGGTSSTPSGQTSSTQTSSTQTTAQPSSTPKEQPVPVISGTQASGSDIPDTQVFVKYTSTPGKYQLDVPEGWAQTTNGTDVNFASNLNAMQVAFSTASTQPTASSVRNDQAVTTNKQVRLENNRYLYFNNGKLATLTLSAPVGADNVDQWLRIARSFKWV
jgi:hypothetical protein